MKALVLVDDCNVVLNDVPEEVNREGCVVVEPRYVGLCGTDKHIYRGEFPERVSYPTILGHEFSGIIAEVGPSVVGLEPGMACVVDPICWCQRCPACLEGRFNACSTLKLIGIDLDGGLCERRRVPASKVFPIPSGVSLKDAAVIELFAVACHAIKRASISPGDLVVVIGAGRLGLCLTSVLACTCAVDIVAVDPAKARRDLAADLGATVTIDPAKEDPIEKVKALSAGRGADRVFEAVGHHDPIEDRDPPVAQALDMVRSAGRAIIMGQGGDAVPILWKPVVFKEAEVVTSRVNLGEFPRALALAERGRIRPDKIITHTFPLSKGKEAFGLLDSSRQDVVKIVVEMD